MSRGDKNPGILNLNAPLLSTRRPLFRFRHRLSTSSRPISPPPHQERIPFSWERAPGQPKLTDSSFPPRPRPPPRLYRSPCNFTFQHHMRETEMSRCDSDTHRDEDDDDDDGYYCCYNNPASGRDSLSTSNVNAADVFSLSEAIDVLEKAEGPAARESDSNLTALKMMAESAEDSSPSFMINRFLPDAKALAASSTLRYYSRNWNNKTTRHRRHGSCSSGYGGTRDEVETEGEGRSNRKGCGMERVFQWRVKPRLCGDSRSPALPPSSILGNRRNPS